MHLLWRQSPIVPFLFALIAGIVTADSFPHSIPLWAIALFAIVCVLPLFLLRNNVLLLIGAGIATFFCGIVLASMHQLTDLLPQQKQMYYAEVVSIGRESAKAKNAVLVLYEHIADTAFQVGEQQVAGIFLKKHQHTDSLATGQVISFAATMKPIAPDNNFAVSQLRKGIRYRTFVSQYRVCGTKSPKIWEVAQRWLRNNILSQRYMDQHLLVKGIVLGDKIGFTKESLLPYQQAGFMQHLSVSGMHIGIIATLLSMLSGALSKSHRSKIISSIASVCIVWLYVAMADFAPAAVRAAIMFSLVFLMNVTENQPSKYNILASTALGMLVLSPMLVFDVGFQLSFAAMVGLIASLRLKDAYIGISNPIVKYIAEGFIVGIGAQLCTLPFCLYYFGYYPTYSLIFGFAAGVVVFGIMALVLVAIVAFFVEMQAFVGATIDFLANMLEFLAQFSNSLPMSSISFKQDFIPALIMGAAVLALVVWCECLIVQKREKQFA